MTSVLGENTSRANEVAAAFSATEAKNEWGNGHEVSNFRLPLASAEDPFDFDHTLPAKLGSVTFYRTNRAPRVVNNQSRIR